MYKAAGAVILLFLCLTAPGIALKAAEVGGNDFRISDMGPDGDPHFGPLGNAFSDDFRPAIAWNATADQYLIVWASDDSTDGEFEIFGQLLDGDGNEIGTDFRISNMGPDGDGDFDALHPAVAWNQTNNGYLVVWQGDDDTAPLVNDEFEIFGQLLAADGSVVLEDFRISAMGPDMDTAFGAFKPAVVWNETNNAYLVVWHGDDNTDLGNGPLADDEFEIFGQLIEGQAGLEIGADFRVSDMSTDGVAGARDPDNPDADYMTLSATDVALAWNSIDNEYLVVWQGNDDTGRLVEGEFEIFGQRLDATGNEIGGNDFRISDMSEDGVAGSRDSHTGNIAHSATDPAVAYSSIVKEYLVVWQGNDVPLLAEGEFEIFGQRLSATGVQVGANDFRLSHMGSVGGTALEARRPAVAWNEAFAEYLVAWDGDDSTNGEFEIYAQRLGSDGTQFGANTRLSDMGPEDDVAFDALNPALTWNEAAREYLVVWRGNDGTDVTSGTEYEIFGQRFAIPATLRFAQRRYRVSEGGGHVVITVQRVGNTSGTTMVDYVASDGTAMAPSDYTAVSGTLTFDGPQGNALTFEVLISDDDDPEDAETIHLSLINPKAGALIDPTAATSVVTIVDNDDDGSGSGGGGGGGGASKGGGGSLGVSFLLALLACLVFTRRYRFWALD